MLQCAITMNQFMVTYSIEFNAEPRWCILASPICVAPSLRRIQLSLNFCYFRHTCRKMCILSYVYLKCRLGFFNPFDLSLPASKFKQPSFYFTKIWRNTVSLISREEHLYFPVFVLSVCSSHMTHQKDWHAPVCGKRRCKSRASHWCRWNIQLSPWNFQLLWNFLACARLPPPPR